MAKVVHETQIPGRFLVDGRPWNVGERYQLHGFVGAGAYGEVCKATDRHLNQTIALKKVPEILCSPVLAKRVLREVCIMRRLIHPYIITLTDVFLHPSEEVNGEWDLYIATEFAARGDLYHFRGSLTPDEVKSLMWQLLLGVNYMHSCRVWHRDIKSDNALLTEKFRIKLCDFGLARSAEETPVDDFAHHKKVLSRQYTKNVVTQNYRAPEVIMSQGQYTSAIDIWAVGCVFWELIMRNVRRNLRCPPLFAVCGSPITPEDGESYSKDGVSLLAKQMNFIFDVIGTPCWKDIESVPSESWRNYLKRLSGRAGNLTSNLKGLFDEQAIDLLSRMLEFDPSRRCTSEEALAHAYFKDMKRPTDTRQLISEDPASAISTGALWKIKDPSVVLEQIELQLEAADKNGGMRVLMTLLANEIQQQRLQDLIKRSFLGSFQAAKLQLQFVGPKKAIADSGCKESGLPTYETKQKQAMVTSECKESGLPPYETEQPTRKHSLTNPGNQSYARKQYAERRRRRARQRLQRLRDDNGTSAMSLG